MTSRELDIKEIAHEIAIWERKMKLLGSINLLDANIISEHLVQLLLNEIFGYNLVNANSIKKNFPAIDLIDVDNRIAFQVTSTPNSNKIQKTIDSFVKNQLDLEIDILYILVFSTKQKSYKTLNIEHLPSFKPEFNILDLSDILHKINYLTTGKINKLRNIIVAETANPTPDKLNNSANRIKKAISNKKKFSKNFLQKLPRQLWERAQYEPWIRFLYHNVILRDPLDREFPKVNDNSKWVKAEFWDTYDQGIELISHGRDAVFDAKGNWDILNYENDKRQDDLNYSVKPFWVYPRLSFADIIEIDMNTDDYYSLPTIYCHFSYDKYPYEEIMFGEGGSYADRSWRQLFDNTKRKKDGW